MINLSKILFVGVLSIIVLTSCDNQNTNSVEPTATVNLVAGSTGAPRNLNFITVNSTTIGTGQLFAFQLNVVSPKSFQALEITRKIFNQNSGNYNNNGEAQLIYLGLSGYDAAPYITNQVLGGQLSTSSGFFNTSNTYPNGFNNPLIQTGLPFASSYLTTSTGFIFETGNNSNVIEEYTFTVTDNYGRQATNYLHVTVVPTVVPIVP